MGNLDKLQAEDFPKSIHHHPTMMISEDDWEGVPYRSNPNCSICKGAGYVHPQRPDGSVDYKQIAPCSEPGCLLDSIRGNQPRELTMQTFETFQPIPGTEKALKAAKALACGESSFIWFLLYGQPGNGKTHLCNAIVKEVRGRGLDVRMILAADLFSMLRENMEGHKADGLLRQFKEVFFLAIDDYGVEYGSNWEMAKFDELMTSRYANDKPTVLITNKDLTELPERIQDRFRDKVMAKAIHNSAGSYRPIKR